MSSYDHEWLKLRPAGPGRTTTLGALGVFGSALLILDLALTVWGSSSARPGIALAVVVAPLPVMLWWAYAKAGGASRRPIALLASAATVWSFGLLLRQGFELAGAAETSLRIRDGLFVAAQLLVVVGLTAATGARCCVRLVVLDTAAVAAALVSLGALLARPGSENSSVLLAFSSLILSVAALMLVLSSALRPSGGVPLSIGVFGFAEIPLIAGNLIHGYAVISGQITDDRWAELAWAAGAIVATLAASAVVMGIDQRLRLPVSSPIPDHVAGARPLVLLYAFAPTLPLGVAGYGVSVWNRGLAFIGLGAAATGGLALAARARESLRTAEAAYRRLDRSLADSERSIDGLVKANTELAHANVQSRAMQIAFADLLNLTNERTQGRLRQLVEETGDELAALLEEQLEAR